VAKVEQTWSADTFDAIGIRAHGGQFVIQGIDEDEVKLEGNLEGRSFRNMNLEPSGRWLQIYTSGHHGDSQFTLQLPKRKVWMVDIFSGRAQFKAENVKGRLHLMLGKGEVQVENCRGAFSVTSGNADVRLKHFVEVDTPEIPPLPKGERHIRLEDPESWQDWGEDYWTQWGGEFGEKLLRRFFGENTGPNAGVRVQTGKGDVNLEDIDAKACIIRAARGEARLKQGRVGELDMKIISGDIECESCLPAGDWTIRTNRGDIHLSLPADTNARLDVTTRQGDIQSKTPLVRVTRQGPGSWHGSRMVGTMGNKTEGKMPEIHISTLSGDIEIKTQPTTSPYYQKSETVPESSTSTVTKKTDAYNTQLDVLTALSEGRINVDEAERLLKGLKS